MDVGLNLDVGFMFESHRVHNKLCLQLKADCLCMVQVSEACMAYRVSRGFLDFQGLMEFKGPTDPAAGLALQVRTQSPIRTSSALT